MGTTIQMRSKGVITLPIELRRQYDLAEGDVFTLVDLGEGAFILFPQISQVTSLGDRVAQVIDEEGITTEEMLQVLAEEREQYYLDHYVED